MNTMRYHSYVLFDRLPSWNTVSQKTRTALRKDFVRVAKKSTWVRYETYATLGFRPQSRFLMHLNADSPHAIQEALHTLLETKLGAHLTITYTMLGMTRSSQYNPKHAPKESNPDTPHTYLVVYPFTKTIDWHLLPFEERRSMMHGHVMVGKKYAETISQLLLYAFGIDDHEFIVSYQMDDLELFQTLVMELRGTEARRYTNRDTPIILGTHVSLPEALLFL